MISKSKMSLRERLSVPLSLLDQWKEKLEFRKLTHMDLGIDGLLNFSGEKRAKESMTLRSMFFLLIILDFSKIG